MNPRCPKCQKQRRVAFTGSIKGEGIDTYYCGNCQTRFQYDPIFNSYYDEDGNSIEVKRRKPK